MVMWKGSMDLEEVRAVLARALRSHGPVGAYDPVTGHTWVVGPRGCWARGYMEAGCWGYGLDCFRGRVVSEGEVPLSAILVILTKIAGVDTEEALKEVLKEGGDDGHE